MTTVPSVGTSSTQKSSTENSSTTAPTKAEVDYQSFLKLLVAQMKNQDPTQPMDSTQYVAQLAQFSNVEQSIQVNKKLSELLQVSAISQANSLLGRTVTSADGETTGVVAQVKLATNGVIAVLESGKEVVMQNGVVVTDTPESTPQSGSPSASDIVENAA
ncbi:MAG: flagellar hook assembly protein FlgD [Rhizobiaceae bacterium]|nr:flagellar hook assembly protein FlgD [Rhizobiaceae bacterium]